MMRPRVFISAVSTELAGARREVARVLRSLAYDCVSAEDFSTGDGELKLWLARQIDSCEGLIQLVGDAYGAEPPASSDPNNPWPHPDFGRCSYTQFELLYAWQHAKPAPKRTWVILVASSYPRERPLEQLDLPSIALMTAETADSAAYQALRRELQRAYIVRLTADNHLRHSVTTPLELENLLRKLKDELAELRQAENRRQHRLGRVLAAVLLGLVMLGAGGWWGYQMLSGKMDTAATITAERIEAHLHTAVEATYQRDLEAADKISDWREREPLRKAAEAQRNSQLARIKALAASFGEIEQRGESARVFKELKRISAEQGITEALAYIESKRSGVLGEADQINQDAKARVRDKLQSLLTAAGLYQTTGDAAKARALYNDILQRAPDWPSALGDDYAFLIAQGEQAMFRGNLAAAKQDLLQARTRAEQLIAQEPENRGYQQYLADAWAWIGDVEVELGHSDAGLVLYQRYHDVLVRLAAADPSNLGWQYDLSVSLNKVGEIELAHGDLSRALKVYKESTTLRKRITAIDPTNSDWQRGLAMSLENLGDVKSRQGDLTGARDAYEESKTIRERLATADPSNTTWQRDFARSLLEVGAITSAQGDPASALEIYGRSLAITEQLATTDPSNAWWQYDLAHTYETIGSTNRVQNKREEAFVAFQRRHDIVKTLTLRDPNNTRWQRDLSLSFQRLGDLEFDHGNLEGALSLYEKSFGIAEHLVSTDPNNAQWKYDLGGCYESIGSTKEAQDKLEEALVAFQRKHAIVKALTLQDPGNTHWRRDLYVSQWKLAALAEQRGNLEEARNHWREAYDVLRGIRDGGFYVKAEDLGFLKQLEEKLQRLDDPAAAAHAAGARFDTNPDSANE